MCEIYWNNTYWFLHTSEKCISGHKIHLPDFLLYESHDSCCLQLSKSLLFESEGIEKMGEDIYKQRNISSDVYPMRKADSSDENNDHMKRKNHIPPSGNSSLSIPAIVGDRLLFILYHSPQISTNN